MDDHADFDPSEVYIDMGEEIAPSNVRRVEVHSSVEEIEDLWFEKCSQLESVLLHEGLLEIGDSAFEHCSSLRSIRCPSTVTKIGEGAFCGCSNLATVELPDGLESIEDNTFCWCTSLEEVQMPSSVARIGGGAFEECTNLVSVGLCEGLRKIENFAFINCRSLESLRIPLSVDEIGQGAFYGCRGLSLVRLHENLSTIERSAFRGCPPESFQFARISERREAISMDEQTTSMFESRLSEMMRTLTDADDYDEDEDEPMWGDDDGEDARALALWEKCKESLGRAHEVLTYLELKGASPVLELALWKAKIEGEGGEGAKGELGNSEYGRQNLSDAGGKRKRPQVTNSIGQDTRLSREDYRVKCGAGIVIPEVLKFFTYRSSWPRLGNSEEGHAD